MLRRTALILVGFLLLSLGMTVAYALIGFGGPNYTIHKSRQALLAEDYLETIRLAGVALGDRALDTDPELRRQALRIRYQAYAKVGDYRRALEDLKELIEKLRDSDVHLVLSRIQITLERARAQRDMSQALRALEQTRMVLEKDADNPQALALAGDACRVLYEDELLKLRERLAASLSPRLLQTAMARLTDSSFRPAQDPKVPVLERELQTLLPERKNQHPELRNSIRTWVLRGQDCFLRALRQEHPPARAYLGLDDILAHTGRDDQRLALAQIYMQRAKTRDALTAVAVAARLHLDAGRYRACVGTVQRVTAPDAWRRLAESNAYGPQLQPALLAKHLALAKLGETDQLLRSAGEVSAMVPKMPMKWPLYDLIQGVALAGSNDSMARDHLRWFVSASKLPATWWTERQLLRMAYERRVEVEQRLGTDPTVIANALAAWSGRDPKDPRPQILTARLWLRAERPAPALAAAAHALRLAENDDVLRLHAETAVAAVAAGPRDLPQLLERCLRLRKTVPDNIGDLQVLVLPVAERALRAGHTQIALACASLAADHYPWARWPRYLLIEAWLAAGRPEDAARALRVLLRYHSGDRRANELSSRVLAGNPDQAKALRHAAAVYSAPNLDTARFLARRLYARGEWDRVLAVTRTALPRYPADAELMSLAARVLLHRGEQAAAGRLLAAIHALPQDQEPAAPRSPWALGQLILHDPTHLAAEFRAQLLQTYLEAEHDPGQVFALAKELAEHGEDDLARRAAAALVTDRRFHQQRTAAWFQLAGRTALAAGRLQEAREHLVAAAGFGDARGAALDLTLLHLANRDLGAARESFLLAGTEASITASITDSITAALVAARLGPTDAARARIRYQVAADPDDIPALCMLACVDPDAKVPPPVRALANATGDELLELLAFLSTDAFFTTAVARATDLAKKHPNNPVAILLGLRALVRSGQTEGVVPALLALRLDSPVLMLEALRILNASQSPELRNSELMNNLLAYVVAGGPRTNPALLAIVLRHDKRLFANPDLRAAILATVADFWIRYPKLADVGLDEVDVLTTAGMYKPALQLLEVIQNRLPASERPRFLRTSYELAPKVIATEPHLAPSFMNRAHKSLTEEGPHGTVLHFLLETRDVHEPWPTDPEAREARRQEEILFLRAHVERYHAGVQKDRATYLKSLARLFQLEDPTESLARMEQTLQDDPSLLDLWCFRARRLLAAHELDRAIDGLAWIPPYLEDPAIEETLLPLKLRRDGTLEGSESPGSPFARGLLALHDLDHAAAVTAFGNAAPQVDGSHLFYLAIAHLGQMNREGREAAAATFTRLQREYPRSPLAFLAPEFAAQCRQ